MIVVVMDVMLVERGCYSMEQKGVLPVAVVAAVAVRLTMRSSFDDKSALLMGQIVQHQQTAAELA